MKKFLILFLLATTLLAGCATVDYLTKPENQQVLTGLGVSCFQGPDVKVGAAYIIRLQNMQVKPTTSGEFLVGCGDKWWSVICDVTKKPSENPCSDLKEYDLKPIPVAEPAVPVVIPAVEPAVPVPPAVAVPIPPVVTAPVPPVTPVPAPAPTP